MPCIEIARGSSAAASDTVTATRAGADITGGHIVVCAGENDDGQATATCADTDSNTYRRDDNVNNGVGNGTVMFLATNGGTISDGHVFTVTFAASTNRKWAIVYHVDDLVDGTLLDNGRGTGTSQTPSATLDASVSVANTLTIGCGTYNSDGALPWTPDGTDGDGIDLSNRAGVTSFRYRTATGQHSEGGSTTDTGALWSFVLACYEQAAGGAFTLDAAPGSYAVAGAAASVPAARVVDAAPGSYAATGVAAGTVAGRVVDAQPGSYALVGTATGLVSARVLEASPGVYTVTGPDAAVVAARILAADPGAYVLTGIAADLVGPAVGFFLNAEPGAFALTGLAAGVLADRVLDADPGVLVVTGAPAALIADHVIEAAPGVYVVTGGAAAVVAGRVLAADPGAYLVTGDAATLLAARVLAANQGAYVLSGIAAELVAPSGDRTRARAGSARTGIPANPRTRGYTGRERI